MTVGFAYETNPRVIINVFLPSNQARLQAYLGGKPDYESFREEIKDQPMLIRRDIHDC